MPPYRPNRITVVRARAAKTATMLSRRQGIAQGGLASMIVLLIRDMLPAQNRLKIPVRDGSDAVGEEATESSGCIRGRNGRACCPCWRVLRRPQSQQSHAYSQAGWLAEEFGLVRTGLGQEQFGNSDDRGSHWTARPVPPATARACAIRNHGGPGASGAAVARRHLVADDGV